MEGSSYGDGGGPVATINIVPLVDIMLVMLVIFMVTTPMMQQGIEVNLPKSAAGGLRGSNEQIVLSIDKAGQLYLGSGNKVAVAELAAKAEALMSKRPPDERKIYIKADTALQYGRVMEAMAALHAGGITQIGLVSAPLSNPRNGATPRSGDLPEKGAASGRGASPK